MPWDATARCIWWIVPAWTSPRISTTSALKDFATKNQRWNPWIPYENPWINQWLIHGLSMVYPWQKSWFIIGKPMDDHGFHWLSEWMWSAHVGEHMGTGGFLLKLGKKPEVLSCVPWSHGSWSSLFHVNIWQCGGSILTSLYLLFLQSQVIRFLWSWVVRNPVTSGNLLHSYWKWP